VERAETCIITLTLKYEEACHESDRGGGAIYNFRDLFRTYGQ
jgi:hypothetical protein